MAFITNTDLDRQTTSEELASIEAKITEMTTAGVTDGVKTVGDLPWQIERTWTTEAAANEWLAFMNALTPGPISVTVTSA